MPAREDVVAWWRELLDGRAGPEVVHARVRHWVEEEPGGFDPVTMMGLQQLHGGAGREAFERWLAHAERYDTDLAGWERDRLVESLYAVRRDQGP